MKQNGISAEMSALADAASDDILNLVWGIAW